MLLEEVVGIPTFLLKRLKDARIITVEDFALTPKSILIEVFGEQDKLLSKIKELIPTYLKSYDITDSLKTRFYISTGSRNLDALLNGGVKSRRLVDFFGERGSGKIQLCFTASTRAATEGKVFYVDASGSFRPERIEEICSISGLSPKEILEKIFVYRTPSVYDQEKSLKILEDSHGSIKLLVVDSVARNFVVEFGEAEFLGEEGALIRRQSRLMRYLWRLSRLAIEGNIPVIVTNDVRSRPVAGKRSLTVELAQDVMSVCVHQRVQLARQRNEWRAYLRDAYPERSVRFSVGRQGVHD